MEEKYKENLRKESNARKQIEGIEGFSICHSLMDNTEAIFKDGYFICKVENAQKALEYILENYSPDKSKAFINANLNFDLEKLKDFNTLKIVKSFDDNDEATYPFVIDVNDESYFYINEEDRDSDFELLINLLELNQ